MKTNPIIVFDSGIGGMSIYRPLKLALPSAHIIYWADTPNFPYGNKTSAWLSARFKELSQQFAAYNPRLVVIACNTATTHIIEELRSSLSCPVVGIEPVVKPLGQFTSALVLMTIASAESATTAKLLEEHGPHVHVYTSPNLATAIEYNDIDQVKKCLHEIKKVVHKYQIQAIGLSCTHYSLILPLLRVAFPQVTFIDPSMAVVKEVIRVLS